MHETILQLNMQTFITLIGLIVGFALQLIALAIMAIRIIGSNNKQYTEMEIRNATRYSTLATKMERVETDIQTLYKAARFNRRQNPDGA